MHKIESRTISMRLDCDDSLVLLSPDLVHDAVRSRLIGVAREPPPAGISLLLPQYRCTPVRSRTSRHTPTRTLRATFPGWLPVRWNTPLLSRIMDDQGE